MTTQEWIVRGKTGLSSKTIWSYFSLGCAPYWPCEPSDPSDFLRCYWLLKLDPSWRARIGELGQRYERWKPLTDHWDELEAMLLEVWPRSCASGDYENEPPAKKMYARMKELARTPRQEEQK